ncbi:MAG: hypothetical protein U0531_22240 [Dehalococcoidia bacterium]
MSGNRQSGSVRSAPERPGAGAAAGPDAAILEALQERMQEIARGGAPNSGRFCGYCYGRLNAEAVKCRVCGTRTSAAPPVEAVPREALLVYMAHWNKMRLWVNVFAFFGMFIAIVLAGLMVAFLPSALKLLAIPVLLGGAWYFANLLGGGLGGYLGNRSGSAARARKWQAYLAHRAGVAPDA